MSDIVSGIDTSLQAFRDKWYAFLSYTPHTGQKKLIELFDSKRFVVSVCGRRWGKSLASARLAELVLLQPNKRVGIFAPTYKVADKVFREIWQDVVIKGGYEPQEGSSRTRHKLYLPWGSFVEGISMDKTDSSTGLGGLGEEYDIAIIDEAAKLKEASWVDYIRPSLSTRRGKAVFITTPWGHNWIYKKTVLGNSGDPDWGAIQSPTWENIISFPLGKLDPDILEYKRNASQQSFDQNYGAQFVTFAGQVYPFDRNIHVVENLPYEKTWQTYASVDFGRRMPAVVWFQVGKVAGENEVHIIDEILHVENLLDEQLLQMIKARNREKGYNINNYYGDPAGDAIQSMSGMATIQLFRSKGLVVRYKTDKLSRVISNGVELVSSYLMNAEGKQRLFISSACPGVIEDFEMYRYPEHRDGSRLKEDPIKDGYHDHGMDAVRYFFLNRFPIKATYKTGYSPRG